MKRISLIIITLFISCYNLIAQNSIERVLVEIGKNNTRLIALKKRVEADKIGSRTGIYPSNPELDVNYLFSSPSLLGNRTDISIKQTFDFPSAYGYKSKIASSQNMQSELEYQNQLMLLLYQARLLIIDLLHSNALKNEYEKRYSHAHGIVESYRSKLEKGEGGILELNKAQLNLLNISKDIEGNEINRTYLLSELSTLNGGMEIKFADTAVITDIIPEDFEQWYLLTDQSNPTLDWMKQEIKIMDLQEKLNLALSFPKFSAGYMSEKTTGQQFQGISAGISIPLWENKNSLKYAKAQAIAVRDEESANKNTFMQFLKTQHAKTISLQKLVSDYRVSLQSFDNDNLLKKALDLGEISLTDYFYGVSSYYESMNKLLDVERELNRTVASLNQYSR